MIQLTLQDIKLSNCRHVSISPGSCHKMFESFTFAKKINSSKDDTHRGLELWSLAVVGLEVLLVEARVVHEPAILLQVALRMSKVARDQGDMATLQRKSISHHQGIHGKRTLICDQGSMEKHINAPTIKEDQLILVVATCSRLRGTPGSLNIPYILLQVIIPSWERTNNYLQELNLKSFKGNYEKNNGVQINV